MVNRCYLAHRRRYCPDEYYAHGGGRKKTGDRLTLGAKKSHIIFQFLTESVILTFSGGILGVGVGVIIALLIRHMGKPIGISWQPFAIAFVLSVLIGLFFGVYPAKKAANLDPVDALNQ